MTKERLIGIGLYTTTEAARLTRIPAQRIRRWLGGYAHRTGTSAPLWTPGVPQRGKSLELTFSDLMELRFVQAFMEAGVGLPTIRRALSRAREMFGIDRPFATQQFRTDGRRIFLEIGATSQDRSLIDLNRNQYAFRDLVAPSFVGLEFEDDRIARWRPWNARPSIVIDPARSFGAPILDNSGVPTRAIGDAFAITKSFAAVASDFDVPERDVRDAVAFEERLAA